MINLQKNDVPVYLAEVQLDVLLILLSPPRVGCESLI